MIHCFKKSDMNVVRDFPDMLAPLFSKQQSSTRPVYVVSDKNGEEWCSVSDEAFEIAETRSHLLLHTDRTRINIPVRDALLIIYEFLLHTEDWSSGLAIDRDVQNRIRKTMRSPRKREPFFNFPEKNSYRRRFLIELRHAYAKRLNLYMFWR